MSNQTEYRNPWYQKLSDGSPIYRTDAKPTNYRGYQIFHRAGGWDVVKDGVCRTQRAGHGGARAYVDAALDHSDQCECSICLINRAHCPELHVA